MGILLMIHSIVRWIVLILALLALAMHAIGLVQSRPYSKMARGLMSGFTGSMDLQALLGLILLIWGGVGGVGWPRYRLEHTVALILAVALAHLPARWKEAADRVRYRNNLLVILGVLLLIVAGIAVLPGNRWTMGQ